MASNEYQLMIKLAVNMDNQQVKEVSKAVELVVKAVDTEAKKNVSVIAPLAEQLKEAKIDKALQAATTWMKECATAAIDLEAVMANVNRTVGGSDAQLAQMSAEFKSMANEIPLPLEKIGDIAKTAGQLGVSADHVAEFSRVVGVLGATTDLTADQGASLLAQFASATDLDPTMYVRLGSTVAALGDQSGTTAAKVAQMSQGMAAALNIAGFAETDILAVGAAVSSLGIDSQTGSAAISSLVSSLSGAVQTGGDKLVAFASIANMTADEFSIAWREDAAGAMNAFVQGVGDAERSGRSTIDMLKDLGITNEQQIKTVLDLAGAGDRLSDTLNVANRAWADNNALQEKASSMNSTTKDQLMLLNNAYKNLKIAIGENYSPALEKAASLGQKMLEGITGFVERNPEAVAAISTLIGVLGAATAAIGLYTGAVKIAKTANEAFKASIPVIGTVMKVVGVVALLASGIAYLSQKTGEAEDEIAGLSATSKEQYYALQDLEAQYADLADEEKQHSAEAQLLKRQIEEETEAFEQNKRTKEEVIAASEAVIKSYQDMMGTFHDSLEEIEEQDKSVTGLIDGLERLTQAGGNTAAEQQQILAIVDLLNETMPDLGLTYDEYNSKLNMSTDALKKLGKEEIDRLKNDANQKKMKQEIIIYDKLKSEWISCAAEVEDAERLLAEAQAKPRNYGDRGTSPEYTAGVKAAQKALDEWKEKEENARLAYEASTRSLNDTTESIAAFEAETKRAAEVQGVWDGAQTKINAMAESYKTLYDEAYQSIDRQMGLFETMSYKVETSTEDMIESLKSQSAYMETYGENLKAAAAMGLDEGLLAQLSDGSKESAAYLEAIVTSGEESIGELNAAFGEVEQGKKDFADNMAEVRGNFEEEMEALVRDLEVKVQLMNFESEAGVSARKTIQGFIHAAKDPESLQEVFDAYAKIGQTGIDGIQSRNGIDSNSPSKKAIWSGEMVGEGLMQGVLNKETETMRVMQQYGAHAVEAISPETQQILTLSPTLLSALQQKSVGAAPSAALPASGKGGGDVQIIINPGYHINGGEGSGGITQQLHRNNEDLATRVRDVLEEMAIDARRVSF